MSAATAHQQGLAAYKTSSFETAAALFSTAITIDPARASTYHARAKAYEQLGRIRDALADAREVVKLRPASYEGYFLAGRLYKIAGKLDKAKQLLSQALTKTSVEQAAQRKAIEREMEGASESLAQAQFSPLSSLPTELFIDIISIALDAHSLQAAARSSSASLVHPVLAASFVCRQWRRTIEAAPRLWTTLSINGTTKSSRQKARWWASRAVGLGDPARRAEGWGPGLSKLILSRSQVIGTQGLSDMLEELEQMGAFRRLDDVTCSWVDGAGTTAVQQHQLHRVVTFLRAHATTLRAIKLETDAHLRINFSVPRLGHTFSALRSLELRSTAATVTAPDVFIPSSLLPPYDGEEEWPPMAITRLVLVGPVWRLEFKDGTIASPTLAASDCPALMDVELGPTSPSMTWELFSAPSLRHLRIHRQSDQPMLPKPNLSPSAATLATLSLVSSPALTTRLIDSVMANSTFFPALTSLNLTGATLHSSLLAHFGSAHSPHLAELRLPRSNARQGETITLAPFFSVEVLDVSLCQWVTTKTVEGMGAMMPKLARLNMSGCPGMVGRAIVELVESKFGATRIKELNLTLCEGLKDKELVWLRANLRAGAFKHSFPPLVDDVRRRR